MLDIRMLTMMPHGTVFAAGTAVNAPTGLFMESAPKYQGRVLRWAARRGGGPHDWAIYCLWNDQTQQEVLRRGDKVRDEKHVRLLVPCDDEAMESYRH